MRQFVLGLLVAAFVWWGWSSWFVPAGASGADTGAQLPAPAPAAGIARTPLSEMLEASHDPIPPTGAASTEVAGNAAPAAVEAPLSVPAFDPAAFSAADDFATLLARLGTDNTFLHSPSGRAAAGKVLAIALALPDPQAVDAGSRLLELCLRGRIAKGDADVRAFVDDAYRQHRIRVDRWLCDPANVAGARSHTVQRGESLAKIASRFRREKIMVEDGTLAILNRIHNANAVQVGQRIKVPIDPIRAVCEKRSYSLAVYVGAQLLRLYWIGHGEHDRTPIAEFTVAEKLASPEWTAPDGQTYPYGHPKNILGEYFIKFEHASYTGFGAHGTPSPETICTMSSAGCLRLVAADIADLFKVLPRGAKVEVRASESVR